MATPFILVLDFDGVTLHGFHHNPEYRRPWDKTIEEDIGFVRADAPKIFKHADYKLVAQGSLDLKDFLRSRFLELDYHGSADDFVAYWHGKDTNPQNLNTELLAHVCDLRAHHGIRTYLATQQEPYRARKIADAIDLKAYFDGTYFTCERGLLKTDPAFYEGIATELGVENGQVLYFDDSPPYVEAAQAAGWQTAVYNTLADFEIHPWIAPLLAEKAA